MATHVLVACEDSVITTIKTFTSLVEAIDYAKLNFDLVLEDFNETGNAFKNGSHIVIKEMGDL